MSNVKSKQKLFSCPVFYLEKDAQVKNSNQVKTSTPHHFLPGNTNTSPPQGETEMRRVV